MTTIAYKDGVMAGDSLGSYGNIQADRVRKIRRIRHYLVGLSGTGRVAEEFCEWLATQENLVKTPKFDSIIADDDGVWALIVDTRSKYVYRLDKCGMPYRVEGNFFATGSGMDLAMGAMAAGASAKEAVKIACKYNAGSGGRVDTLHL